MKQTRKTKQSTPPAKPDRLPPESIVGIFRREAHLVGRTRTPEHRMLSQSLHRIANELLGLRKRRQHRALLTLISET